MPRASTVTKLSRYPSFGMQSDISHGSFRMALARPPLSTSSSSETLHPYYLIVATACRPAVQPCSRSFDKFSFIPNLVKICETSCNQSSADPLFTTPFHLSQSPKGVLDTSSRNSDMHSAHVCGPLHTLGELYYVLCRYA